MTKQQDQSKLGEIEKRLAKKKHLLEGIIPIHTEIYRRKRQLELDIEMLTEERDKLTSGQLAMRFDLDF